MKPLEFEPILKRTLWGGDRIIPYKGLDCTLRGVGESWELSAVEGSESVVTDGPHAGQSLAQLIDRYGAELVGAENLRRFGNRFPLLVKFIDAREDLSIQVHPDDALAQSRHACPGKSEMWYVVDAAPGASLLTGFSRPVTPAEYERRVADHTLTEVLARRSIAPGEVFYLPAGRVHSIGAGSLIAEIQQTSDLTYRIYDYGRLDADGRPRELHTELAREAIDYTVLDDYRTPYEHNAEELVPLVDTPQFTIALGEPAGTCRYDLAAIDSFVILVLLEASGTLLDNEGNRTPLRRGQTLLIPASTRWIEVEPDEPGTKLLAAWIR